mgnify:CR=1 FL=1
MKQSVKERTILVLTKPPRIIYKECKAKIGSPKDFLENLKVDKFFNNECQKTSTSIPSEITKLYFAPEEKDDEDIQMS